MTAFSWFQPEFQRIAEDANAGRLAHALMLTGVEGIGVNEFAYDLACYRLCDKAAYIEFDANNQNSNIACGDCKSCRLIASGSHPDLKILEPEGAAQIIKVDQIRAVIDFVSQTPQISAWKTIVIRPAHRMNHNASNALLKALEEPPGNSLLILATDRPQTMLPTIRSRCAQIRLPAPTEEQTEQWLNAQGFDGKTIKDAIELIGCKPLKIQYWRENNLLSTSQTISSTLGDLTIAKIGAVDAAKSLSTIEKTFLMDALIRQVALNMKKHIGESRLFSRYETTYDLLLDAKRSVESGANPNLQLLLESIFIRWPSVKRTQ